MNRGNSGNSYNVTGGFNGGGVGSSYHNYGYNNQEMSEFNAAKASGDPYYTGTGRSGGLKGVAPPYYNGNMNGNVLPGSAGTNGKDPIVPSVSRTIDDDDDVEERDQWGSKAEFILSCVGYSVGIGNVWRFPYLAFQNGGGAFLLPYFILLIFVGKPMYYMETAMGQFARVSPLQIWECAPIVKGVGFAMMIVSLIVAIYYNVIMSYAIIYMAASFDGIGNSTLPWTYCNPDWATENCTLQSDLTQEDKAAMANLSRCYPSIGITENCTYVEFPNTQFWERFVLNITKGGLGEPGDLGGFNYPLPLALLFSWTVVFLCLMKGVKSSGKVVYFTATFPYVVLIAILIQGCLLEGATDGLYYLFVPKWESLMDFKVWRKAAEQMFFSLGISWGGLIMFGSYNKFNNKINIDASVISSIDFFTSVISSCVIFSVLGHLAHESGSNIKDVAEGGQGLAFVAYPAALVHLPVPRLWAVLFFAMLFFLGLDSEFALLETVLTAIYDAYPRLRQHKVKLTLFACVSCFLLGLPCASNSGQYVLDLMDTYGAGFAILWIGIWELIGLMWIYGMRNVCKDIKLMLGSEPNLFWKVSWLVITPLFLIVIFVASLWNWSEPKYGNTTPYPDWAHYVGWALIGVSAVQIPLWAILMTLYHAAKGRISQVVKPTRKWGPGDPQVRRAILDEQSGIARNGRHAYDNQALGY